jgi:hypothetical protein
MTQLFYVAFLGRAVEDKIRLDKYQKGVSDYELVRPTSYGSYRGYRGSILLREIETREGNLF